MMKISELENLIKAHQKELYRFLQFLGASPEEAEDVLQDTFVAAYFHKNLPDLSNINLRVTWLRSVAKNTYFKHCRKNMKNIRLKKNQLLMVDEYWENANENDALFVKKEALNKCLEDLPDKQSEALKMRYQKRLSRQQMATKLEMSENGIKSLLQRLRQALAKCINLKIQEGA